MNALLKKILTPLASLRITVLLLVATMLLVYVGTLAQQSKDNFKVQKEFFHSWLVYMPFHDHVPFIAAAPRIPGGYMFPGGYTLIVAILVNLLAAHTLRFKLAKGDLLLVPVLALAGFFTWHAQASPTALWVALTSVTAAAALGLTALFHGKRTGVIVIHFGLILILVGEMVTSMGQVETQMTLIEGDKQNWTHDVRHTELAVVDPTPTDRNAVTALPADKLAQGDVLKSPGLPFELRVDAYYPNATPTRSLADAPAQPAKATAGQGLRRGLFPSRSFTGVGGDAGKVNAPAAYVTVLKDGKPVDTLMLSSALFDGDRVTIDGKPYDISLRFRRYYKPYTIELLKFTHETWEGSEKAKNFQAHLRLLDPANNVDREVSVRMNQPLRYAGDTIYQSGFDPENDKLTTLQIVRNPGWLMPYLACAVGGLGMFIHFLMNLGGFLGRLKKTRLSSVYVSGAAAELPLPPGPPRRGDGKGGRVPAGVALAPVGGGSGYTLQPRSSGLARFLVPAGMALLAILYAAVYAAPRPAVTDDRKAFHLAEWGELPVSVDGRAMPLDSLARNSLKVISGKQTFVIEEEDPATKKAVKETKVQAIQWLADVLARRPEVTKYKVIRIDEPQVKALLGLSPEEKLFSYNDILPNPEPIQFADQPGWQQVPASQFEYATFQTPGAGGKPAKASISEMSDQTELLAQNLIRWAQQVGLPTATPAMLSDRLTNVTVAGQTARRVDLEGPGTGESGPLRTVAVILNANKRTWVFKVTGPTAAVAADLPKFDALLASMQFNQAMVKFNAEMARVQAKQQADKASLDLYERKLMELGSHLRLFNGLAQQRDMLLVPPLKAGEKWRTLADANKDRQQTSSAEPAFEEMLVTLAAWKDNRPDDFNKAVTSYRATLAKQAPDLAAKASFERFYNHFSPFWVSVGLYIFVVVLGCLSWTMLGGPVARGALAVLVVSLLIHAFGLVSRMYISGRPPVTNLYSSAVFIAFVVVLTCVVLEAIFRNGLAAVAAGFVGFMSLLVADGIEFADAVRGEGDTMAQLQAVLDTNFWLATHVVMITMGYAATFLAGALAILYVLASAIGRDGRRTGIGRVFNGPLGQIFSDDGRKLYVKMVYGVVCFAMLLSFVGTILGGIWADQSWGRFWGWDSKENGAILLVLWNAVILHARWSGLVRDRGLMSLCILGNIVTAWSWFGTNQLGIGLHSYGFTEGVVAALLAFWAFSLAFALFALTPWARWQSAKT